MNNYMFRDALAIRLPANMEGLSLMSSPEVLVYLKGYISGHVSIVMREKRSQFRASTYPCSTSVLQVHNP